MPRVSGPSLPSSLHLLLFVWGAVQAYKLCCITGATAEQTEKLERLQLACLVLNPQAPQPLQTPPSPPPCFFFFWFFAFPRRGCWHGCISSRLPCLPAFLSVASPSRSLPLCLLLFPAHRSRPARPLFLLDARTHARTQPHTHARTHTHTHTHTDEPGADVIKARRTRSRGGSVHRRAQTRPSERKGTLSAGRGAHEAHAL